MAFTVDVLTASHVVTAPTETAAFTSDSFSWDAGKFLVVYYSGQQNSSGLFTFTFSHTTGLTWQEVANSPRSVTYSIGGGVIGCRVAKPASSGSGTITITASEGIREKSIHVFEIDGADLTGADALAAILQTVANNTVGTSQQTVVMTFPATTDNDNLLMSGARSVISDMSFVDVMTTLTDDAPGNEGAQMCGYAIDEAITQHTIGHSNHPNPLGGVAAISIEILGPAVVVEEDYGWGMHVA